MIDPAIEAFFSERKITREEWLPKAAKKASSRAFTTHPSKMSHPSTGIGQKNLKVKTYVSPVVNHSEFQTDGLLRNGNVDTELDTVGDAAALDVDSFLNLKMSDGLTVLSHIEKETEAAKRLLGISSESYELLRSGLLAIKRTDSEMVTSSKIKQVYFPVPDGYHQLSLLSNSGIVFELKGRIDDVRFSEKSKEVRNCKKDNKYSRESFLEVYNLTVINYGGAHPKNISSLTKNNYGKAYLLSSMPPTLEKRKIRFPKHNFFKESIRDYEYRDIFHALHDLFKTDYNNHSIREGRDYRIQSLIDLVIDRMWAVRNRYRQQNQAGQSNLKHHQKTWLCDEYLQQREAEDGWLDFLCKEITAWIIHTYERLIGKNAYKLSDAEWLHIHTVVNESREALR